MKTKILMEFEHILLFGCNNYTIFTVNSRLIHKIQIETKMLITCVDYLEKKILKSI